MNLKKRGLSGNSGWFIRKERGREAESKFEKYRVVRKENNFYDKGERVEMSASKQSLIVSGFANSDDIDITHIKDGLKDLFSNGALRCKGGKVNTYMIKFLLRGQKDNVVIPLTLQSDMIDSVYDNLDSHRNDSCGRYDPTSEEVGKYVWLPISEIDEKWDKLSSLINNRSDSAPALNRLSEANLCLIDLEYNSRKYYICLCQNALSGFYKGRKLFKGEAVVKPCDREQYFLFSDAVTFVVTKIDDKMIVYIFNQKNFNRFFSYDEYLKNYATKNLQKIKALNLVDGWDELDKRIEKQYVYTVVAKILKDTEYLDQMRKVDLFAFKERILQKQETPIFLETDFTVDGKLKLTKTNFRAFINILGKKNRYNYFTDIVEE